ncbi:bcl-2-interacting killer isoform X7 [Phocoena sinus]|uniref:bcl-2-interacting killer isoform X7 n=1 Tax=Phocoena sinus TaxID=42100 RepID=UPI0013C4A71C|nr:bcl-2-interacting killer isoform X7 [Phocoena sinus]
MASSTGPRRRRGAPEPRTFEGPETGRPRDAGSPEQELRAERARRPPPTHAQCREEMYQARPLSRNLFLYTFLQNHGPGFLDDQGEGLPGVTNILEFHPVSPYSHIGLRDVLRSFMVAFTNLRENRSLWSFLTLRDRVSPSPWPELALSLLLVVTLSWGRRLH